MSLHVEITNEQDRLAVDEERLRVAVQRIVRDASYSSAEISVAVVDDRTIHELNRQYLNHDNPTDVISFVLSNDNGRLEGEVIASADTAASVATRLEWPAEDELLLYVIHGTLHLVGYDDLTDEALQQMRIKEREYLGHFGLDAPYDDGASPPADLLGSVGGDSPGEQGS